MQECWKNQEATDNWIGLANCEMKEFQHTHGCEISCQALCRQLGPWQSPRQACLTDLQKPQTSRCFLYRKSMSLGVAMRFRQCPCSLCFCPEISILHERPQFGEDFAPQQLMVISLPSPPSSTNPSPVSTSPCHHPGAVTREDSGVVLRNTDPEPNCLGLNPDSAA